MTAPIINTVIILLLILLVPICCRKLRIPSIVGLILAGVALGPHGLGLLERDATVQTLSSLGVLYVMFLSGIEIDIDDFRSEKRRSIWFGLLTFLLPLVVGWVTFLLLGLSMMSSLLIASIFASHTLMTYPVVSRTGIRRNPAVSITIGATIFTVTASMLILAGVSSICNGLNGIEMWMRLGVGLLLMVVVIFYVFPRLMHWALHRLQDVVVEWGFVMALAALGGLMAYAAGLEPILGVFLTALALNKQIPNVSPLMNRISFAGNALFIPIFLLNVGMLIDLRVFVQGWWGLVVAAVMLLVAIPTKWLAAYLLERISRRRGKSFTAQQRRLVFGLTNSHAAGALATVMIGYALIQPDGSRLIPETVLNGTIILILVSCAISSFVTEHAAGMLAVEAAKVDKRKENEVTCLLPAVRSRTNRRSKDLAALLIDGRAKIPEEQRVRHIVSDFATDEAGLQLDPQLRSLLAVSGQALWFCHFPEPLANVNTARVLLPEGAEQEPDYAGWMQQIGWVTAPFTGEVTHESVAQWHTLPRMAHGMQKTDLLILVQARPETATYRPEMAQVPSMLQRHFMKRNFVVVYPTQHLDERFPFL